MAPLPRIAFFHGGGSNSKISRIQCGRLQAMLKNEFEFVYFDAPFERGPGPGILPFFKEEEYAPYRAWFKSDELTDGSGYEATGKDGVGRVWEMIKAKGPGGEWVAAMGFSQGTRVVGGLLLDQEMRTRNGEENKYGIVLRFGVLCMGSGKPMLSSVSRGSSYKGFQDDFEAKLIILDAAEEQKVTLPTYHLHGLLDKQLEPGRKQMDTFYEPTKSKLLEINYHHAMPWNKGDLDQSADFVRDAYFSTLP